MPHLSPAAQAILATLAEHPAAPSPNSPNASVSTAPPPHGILPKLERHGLVVRHRGRRGRGGGPDRWRLADGVVAPPAAKPPARRRPGSGRVVRVD